MAACPGFEPDDAVPVALTRSRPDREVSCVHLTQVAGRRGFLPGCSHPGGLPLSAEDAEALIELVQQAGARVVAQRA